MKVFKYILETTDEQTIDIEKGAKILHVATQYVMVDAWLHSQEGEKQRVERICIWALVDELAVTEPRRIFIHGTGHEVNEHAAFFAPVPNRGGVHIDGQLVHGYMGTVHMSDGARVLHVFQEATHDW